jgi:chaperonin cofactor prefoldin
MILKILLLLLALTISFCFYSLTEQVINLENRVELLEIQIEVHDSELNRINTLFHLLIDKILDNSYNLT